MRFDLARGLPTAVRVLHRELGAGRAARVIGALLWRSLGRDPLAETPAGDWDPRAEALSRHQLRPAVRLDDALRDVLGMDEAARVGVLRAVVSETGARFVEAHMPMPTRAAWHAASVAERERFAAGASAPFFNARVGGVSADRSSVRVDVSACRFAELCAALGRPYLAPLFCEADSVWFGRPGARVRLLRTGTIAQGAPRCDFHFVYGDEERPAEPG